MKARVIFADEDLKKAFDILKTENERLYKEICNALDAIKQNAFFGRNVKKDLIPKEIVKKYAIDNLWIYNITKPFGFFTTP